MGKRLRNDKSYNESNSGSSEQGDNVPDGGWGWAVCFGSFLVNFILDGTMFSFGVLLLELLAYFGEGKAKTSWIGSSLLGMSMFMGPIVSMLLERFSCRQITIAGTLMMSAAFVASTFSPNVEMLIITYGIIGGIGCCMSFVSAIIIVGLYFNRKRAIATGIAMSGSGLGTFAYAYLTNYLIKKFDWRGTILILSGLLLNGIVCGALFRPLPLPESRSETSSTSSEENAEDVEEASHFIPKHITRQRDPVTYLQTNNMPVRLSLSTDLAHVKKELELESNHFRGFSSQHDFRDHSRKRHNSTSSHTNQMSKKNVFYSGSLARLPQYQSTLSTDEESGSSSSCPSDQVAACNPTKKPGVKACKALKSNFGLFKDKVFILLLLCNVFWTVQSVPLTFIPDLGVSKNLPSDQAAMLISIVGITNIIGRILSGIITDLFRIKSTVTYTCALLSASVANFLFPWCEGFMQLAICCGCFGLCMATAVSMRTIVLADHLGIEKLTGAFGMVALFQGIAFMTNAPLAGFLYEKFDSYFMPFSFAGLMYFLSGIMCLCVHCISPGRVCSDDITICLTPEGTKNVLKENERTRQSLVEEKNKYAVDT